MSHEEISDNEGFFEAMQDVKPLKGPDKVITQNANNALAKQLKRQALEREEAALQNYLSVEHVEPVKPFDLLEYKKPGVQHGVYKNLRLGKYKIDKVLNLQGCKFNDARTTLFECIIDAQNKGIRTILVKHGLGENSQPFPAFLKSYVNQWLQQIPEVLAFHSTLKHHGGLASLYVLLKKGEQQKVANREINRHK